MLKRIIAHIRNPYVTLTDSFIILMTALTSGCIVAAVADVNIMIAVILLMCVSGFSSVIHSRLFENKKKNYIRGYAFSVIPVEILIIIAMLKYSMDIVGKCLIISVALISVYLVVFFVLSQKRRIRKSNCICGIHSITAVCLTPCIISFTAHWIGDMPILKQPSVPISTDVNYSVSPITTDEWNDMDFNQKFTYLNEIMKAESFVLKMTDTPVLTAVFYPKPLMGIYNYSADTIGINAEHVLTSDAQDVVNSLGHELYHRYEYIIVDDSTRNVTGVAEERIAEYKYDFENPSNSVFDWDDYYNMSIEIDARAMGEKVADKYVLK